MKQLLSIFIFLPIFCYCQNTYKITPYQTDTIWLNNLKNEKNKAVQLEKIISRIENDTIRDIKKNNITLGVSDSLIYYYACDTIIEKRKNIGSDVITISDTVKWFCGDKIFVVLKYKKSEYRLDYKTNPKTKVIITKLNTNNIEKIEFLSLNETKIKYGTLPSIYGTIILYTDDKILKKEMKLK